jgi:NADH-quinone oxidoreductase subunit J
VSPAFLIIAIVTLFAAAAAMSLRNLVHCALSLVVTFAGLAALYLQLDAQFVGFAQILVYVGAVAILIVFAVLLTRSDATPNISACSGW